MIYFSFPLFSMQPNKGCFIIVDIYGFLGCLYAELDVEINLIFLVGFAFLTTKILKEILELGNFYFRGCLNLVNGFLAGSSI